MPRNAKSTRDKLIDAALRLWAEKGLEGTTLGEIHEAAEQRNASALHYHFGSRDGLVQALYERHMPAIKERFYELLELARASKDVRPAAEAIVLPICELITGDWRDRAFVQVFARMFEGTRLTDPEWTELLEIEPVKSTVGGLPTEAEVLLIERIPSKPKPLVTMRMETAGTFMAEAAADYARRLDRMGRRRSYPPELFITNLVDMFIGAVTAPVSAQSTETLAAEKRPAKPRRATA